MRLSSLFVGFLCVVAAQSFKRAVFAVRQVLKSPNAETKTLTLIEKNPDSGETKRCQIHVAKAFLTDVGSVSSAATGSDGVGTGRPYIKIVLTSKGKQLFSEITREHVKEQLTYVAKGTVLSGPRVYQDINSDIFRLTCPLSKQEAE